MTSHEANLSDSLENPAIQSNGNNLVGISRFVDRLYFVVLVNAVRILMVSFKVCDLNLIIILKR